MNTDEFWKREGLDHIIPNTGEQFPEGFDVHKVLNEMVGNKTINEVGCGYGRLCQAFAPEKYHGYDINQSAVDLAKENFPQYAFDVIEEELASSDIVLFYTVLLHISDDQISDFITKYTKNTKTVILAEILGTKWRRSGNPPVFNRELKTYTELFYNCGMQLNKKIEIEYKRYRNTNISFIIFEK